MFTRGNPINLTKDEKIDLITTMQDKIELYFSDDEMTLFYESHILTNHPKDLCPEPKDKTKS